MVGEHASSARLEAVASQHFIAPCQAVEVKDIKPATPGGMDIIRRHVTQNPLPLQTLSSVIWQWNTYIKAACAC